MRKIVLFTVVLALCVSAAGAVQTITKPYTFTNNTKADATKVNADFDTVYTGVNTVITEVNNAAGSQPTLQQRLDTSLNPDGTLKPGITAGQEWVNPALGATYVTNSSFTVVGDQTSIYLPSRRLKITLAGGPVYTSVAAVSFNGVSGLTTIDTVDATLTNPISGLEHSIIRPIASNGAVSAKMVTGYDVSTGTTANTVPVRDGSGNLSGNITGNAATATSATSATSATTATTASAVAWSGVTSKPTTVSGYGITDAITTDNIGSQSVSYATTAGNGFPTTTYTTTNLSVPISSSTNLPAGVFVVFNPVLGCGNGTYACLEVYKDGAWANWPATVAGGVTLGSNGSNVRFRNSYTGAATSATYIRIQ